MNRIRHFLPLVDRLNSGVIGCVGDLMMDHFIYGHVNRISPEAPIPVLQVSSQESMLGGVGNVVRNLGALGCRIEVFSVIGDDRSADEINSLLSRVARCGSHLIREPGRTTSVKVRYVAGGQQLLRADRETTHAISSESARAILSKFEHAIAGCSMVVMSDYAKGVLIGSLAADFINIARLHGKRVIVDPKGSDFARYRHAWLIKPNLKELGDAAGVSVIGAVEQESAARRLIDQTESDYILITRGADGILLVPRDSEALQLPALAREVFDVSGAGDTVAATLAAALGSGASVADAVCIANIAAGIVVSKTGTAVVERSEIIHEVENQSSPLANDKVLRLDEAAERIALWQRMGLKTGLIFGSFGRFSSEEVVALEKARQGCDRLVVAVRGDTSLIRNGESASLPNQRARAYLLASTVFSDAVVICDDPTPQLLLSKLHPDIVSMVDNPDTDAAWIADWYQRDESTVRAKSALRTVLKPHV